MFKALNMQEVEKIVLLVLENTKKLLKDQDIDVTFDKSVVAEIARASFNPQFGARPIKRTVQREIDNLISHELLQDKIKAGDKVKIKFKGTRFEVEKA